MSPGDRRRRCNRFPPIKESGREAVSFSERFRSRMSMGMEKLSVYGRIYMTYEKGENHMMNNIISAYNNPGNYQNVSAELESIYKEIPSNAVFAVKEGEEIQATRMPYEATPVESILYMLDDIDMAMVEEIGRSKYLTSLQIYQYVLLRGFSVKRPGIRNRLKKLMKFRVIREYEMKMPEGVNGLRFYELEHKGFKLARQRGVIFHMGNRYLSYGKKMEMGVTETPEDVKRILAGNMIVLGLLMGRAKMEAFGIMETLRPLGDMPVADGCIIRTAANVKLDEDSILLYEVVRSTTDALEKLADKIQRYYGILKNQDYLNGNHHGYTAFPQLVICGESLEHNRKIDAYLRKMGLWSEEDSILYTEDLLSIGGSLKSLYELKEDGAQLWYSIPSRNAAWEKESA